MGWIDITFLENSVIQERVDRLRKAKERNKD